MDAEVQARVTLTLALAVADRPFGRLSGLQTPAESSRRAARTPFLTIPMIGSGNEPGLFPRRASTAGGGAPARPEIFGLSV
jgi:hypothetical protein